MFSEIPPETERTPHPEELGAITNRAIPGREQGWNIKLRDKLSDEEKLELDAEYAWRSLAPQETKSVREAAKLIHEHIRSLPKQLSDQIFGASHKAFEASYGGANALKANLALLENYKKITGRELKIPAYGFGIETNPVFVNNKEFLEQIEYYRGRSYEVRLLIDSLNLTDRYRLELYQDVVNHPDFHRRWKMEEFIKQWLPKECRPE